MKELIQAQQEYIRELEKRHSNINKKECREKIRMAKIAAQHYDSDHPKYSPF